MEREMSDTKASGGHVRTEVEGHVLKIVFDNTAKKNAITPLMMEQFHEAISLLDRTDDYWVGVVCAEGKDFCAGLILTEFFDKNAQRTGHWKPKAGKIDGLGLENRCRKPVVTAVQGLVYAIGLEIMLTGDIVIAADDCRFSQMEPARGLSTLAGGYFRHLSRAGWGDAMYHLLLCDVFNSERAYKIGFVQEVVPAGTQVERAMAVAQLIAKNSPIAIQATKEAGYRYIEAAEKAAIGFLPELEDIVLKTEDVREGILSFAERRAPNFRGR
jgi:enoyl-CoA hydratase/carnithine racemase